MKKHIKVFLKAILGRRFTSGVATYCAAVIPLWHELSRILSLVHNQRRYADDPAVLLCELRTAAHIVDKGLQVDNWTAGRSQGAYLGLRQLLRRAKDLDLSNNASYQWAARILVEYEAAQQTGRVDRHPLPTEALTMPPIRKDDLLRLIQSRRSVRCFEERPIPIEVLDELANVISWSPTSCNRQPTVLFMTQSPAKVSFCLQQCAGATCLGENIPCFIAVCADTRFYTVRDRNLAFIDTCLGLQNLLLTAHSQNIEGTILNWMQHSPNEERNLRKALGIPDYYLIVLNLILGYSRRPVPVPVRKAGRECYVLVD